MKYFSFLVYLVAFIACHDDHHTEPELPQGQWTESHPFKGIPRTGGVSFTIGDVAYVGLGRTLPTATEALKDFWMYKDTKKRLFTRIINCHFIYSLCHFRDGRNLSDLSLKI